MIYSIRSSLSIYSITAIVILLYFLYKLSIKNFSYWKERNVKYVKPIPIIGNLTEVLLRKQGFGFLLADYYKRFIKDRFFGIFLLNEPILVINDTELIRKILIKDFDYFKHRDHFNDENIDDYASNVLFFSSYDNWRVWRKKLSPLFTSGKLKSMFGKIDGVLDDMTEYLNGKITKDNVVDARQLCIKYSLNSLMKSMFAYQGESFDNENAALYEVGKRLFGYNFINDLRNIGYATFHWLIKIFRLRLVDSFCLDYIKNVTKKSMEERELNNLEQNDLINLLTDVKKSGYSNGIAFHENALVAQGVQIFLAGYETVSTTLSFILYELALHPNIQEKLRDELKTYTNENGKFNYETIHELPYLDQVVKESMRKYPILPYLDRVCMKEYHVPDSDLVIQPGNNIFIPLFGLHYDENYFPNPNEFIPERFAQEIKTFPEGSYIPFGLGPKMCIGARYAVLTIKLATARLISTFDVNITKDTPVPVEFNPTSLTLIPLKKLVIRFSKFQEE